MIEVKKENSGFNNLGIAEKLLETIKTLGMESPTPIQAKSIPIAIEGKDLIGIAQTGTGKTLAFSVPMIQRLALYKGRGLVLLPTRELAIQVDENLRKYGASLGIRTTVLIGGENIQRQYASLRRKPHIIIGTPGRINDHLERGSIKLNDVKVLVLDEADMMFDMGFAPQIEKILKQVPKERQTLLFSATMPNEIIKLAANHMATPVRVEVAPAGQMADGINQEIFIVQKQDRLEQLEKLLRDSTGSVLIFCRTKHGVKNLVSKVQLMGVDVAEIHSNRSLEQRRKAMAGFKSGRYRVLAATDIAARGIDVNNIELVINFDLPEHAEDYVHRVGRTGRAGKTGRAISFAGPNEMRQIRQIEKLIKRTITLSKPARIGNPARSVFSNTEKDGFSKSSRSYASSSLSPRSSSRPYASSASSRSYAPRSSSRPYASSQSSRSYTPRSSSYPRTSASSSSASSYNDSRKSYEGRSQGSSFSKFKSKKSSFRDNKREDSLGETPERKLFTDKERFHASMREQSSDRPSFGYKKSGFGPKKRFGQSAGASKYGHKR